jgi:hypothetical protein
MGAKSGAGIDLRSHGPPTRLIAGFGVIQGPSCRVTTIEDNIYRQE